MVDTIVLSTCLFASNLFQFQKSKQQTLGTPFRLFADVAYTNSPASENIPELPHSSQNMVLRYFSPLRYLTSAICSPKYDVACRLVPSGAFEGLVQSEMILLPEESHCQELYERDSVL
jgi:hypothetical protein